MNGEEVISLYNNLEREKQDAASWASELKKFVYPFSPTGLPSSFSFLGVGLKNLHDSTAVRANQRLAAAHQSFLSDPGKLWFSFEPSAALGSAVQKSGPLKKWLRDCAERTYQALAESNFYTVNHQALLDRCGFGTGSYYGGISNDNRLMFSYVPFDSFVFSEDEQGMPNLLIRRFEWNAVQAARWLGDAKKLNRAMKDAYEDEPHADAQVAMLIANQAADNDNKVTVEQVRRQLAEEYPLAAVPFDDYVEKSDVLEPTQAQQPVTVSPARIRRMESRSIHTASGIEVKIPTEILSEDSAVEFLHAEDGSVSLLIKNVIL